ncbi:solute carrier family 15 member 4 [Lingula anatina]|uniref:Solute carrier family 15 member 4 n=1 Tax=Lingula anatina TaxID=7574 RepID=A0A1S3IRF1_LINAN|nr:solute carrier family 15 member 4 [Lingula anatina]|eukprot:XP_013400104.1 solute carrier family 15 member 4 [Lingula anatina]
MYRGEPVGPLGTRYHKRPGYVGAAKLGDPREVLRTNIRTQYGAIARTNLYENDRRNMENVHDSDDDTDEDENEGIKRVPSNASLASVDQQKNDPGSRGSLRSLEGLTDDELGDLRSSNLPLNPAEIRRNLSKRRAKKKTMQMTIYAIVFFNWLAYQALFVNFMDFTEDSSVVLFTDRAAGALKDSYASLTCLLAVFGGALADSMLGNVNVLLAGNVLSLIGCIIVLVLACLPREIHGGDQYISVRNATFITVVCLVGDGLGVQRSILFSIGPNQRRNQQTKRDIINWTYFLVNLACLIPFLLKDVLDVVTCDKQLDTLYWCISFSPATVLLAVNLLLLTYRRKGFKKDKSKEKDKSNLVKVAQTIYSSSIRGSLTNGGSTANKRGATKPYRPLKKQEQIIEEKRNLTRSFIKLVTVLPCILLVPMVYNEAMYVFEKQAKCMTGLTIRNRMVPFGWYIQYGISVVFIPVFNCVVYPYTHKRYGPSPIARLTFGSVLFILAILVAIFVESALDEAGCGRVSAAQLIPQWTLLGFGALFIFPTGVEFAYMESPDGLKSTIVGFVWTTYGIGLIVGQAMLKFVHKKFRDEACKSKHGCSNQLPPLVALLIFLVVGHVIFIAGVYFYKQPPPRSQDRSLNQNDSRESRRR